jgi:hypothetical protein
MKIYDRDLTGAPATGSGRAQETRKTGGEGGSSASRASASQSGDRVEFSSGLGQLSRALGAFGADRASRVQSLTAQYQSGSYQADSLGTSRAMISEALTAGASA